MIKKEIIKKLEIREVGMEHITQFNNLLRYVFQVTNNYLSEFGWEDFELLQEKIPILKKVDVLGWFDGDKLVSQIAVYPCKVNIHGKIFEMGGVTGVGTYPEYANMGLMKKIMLESLKKMKEKGQLISYLYPYSIPYYRKKGWEIITDIMTFKLKDTQLPSIVETEGLVKRVEIDHKDIKLVYNEFSKINHGSLIRDSLAWMEYWRWEKEEMVSAIYYDKKDQAQGYLFYWISKDVLYIREFIYLTEDARRGIWNFISAHYSMVEFVKGKNYKNEPISFLLDDSDIEETIKPYYMARIVNVKEFLLKFPFINKVERFHFCISDPLLDWNRGIFCLNWDEKGKLNVTREELGEGVILDIQTFTTMLMNYRRPSYLKKIEKIKASDSAIKKLESIIPNNTIYFSDYF